MFLFILHCVMWAYDMFISLLNCLRTKSINIDNNSNCHWEQEYCRHHCDGSLVWDCYWRRCTSMYDCWSRCIVADVMSSGQDVCRRCIRTFIWFFADWAESISLAILVASWSCKCCRWRCIWLTLDDKSSLACWCSTRARWTWIRCNEDDCIFCCARWYTLCHQSWCHMCC